MLGDVNGSLELEEINPRQVLWWLLGSRGSNMKVRSSVRRTEFHYQARSAPGVRIQRASSAPSVRLERAWAELQVQVGLIRVSCALVTLRACCARESVLELTFLV